MSSNDSIFGEVIYSYTRAQAIADGLLVDLTGEEFNFRPNLNICAEAGFKVPVAMTRAAYCAAVQEDGRELPACQDLSGRLWDVLYMLRLYSGRSGGSEVRYKLSVYDGRRHKTVHLKALCGPGDDAEPVITIMLPDED